MTHTIGTPEYHSWDKVGEINYNSDVMSVIMDDLNYGHGYSDKEDMKSILKQMLSNVDDYFNMLEEDDWDEEYDEEEDDY